MMSDQNPHPGDIRHSQIPVVCLTPPPLSGLTLEGALLLQKKQPAPGTIQIARYVINVFCLLTH